MFFRDGEGGREVGELLILVSVQMEGELCCLDHKMEKLALQSFVCVARGVGGWGFNCKM